MLDRERVYTDPDETIESWVFLTIDYQLEPQPSIVAWKIGVGNSSSLLRKDELHIDSVSGEYQLLAGLQETHLDEIRRADGRTTIITPTDITIPMLRTRMLLNEMGATLRGLYHLSIESIWTDWFSERAVQTESWPTTVCRDSADPGLELMSCTPDQLWQILVRIGPFVPEDALTGEPL